MISCKLEITYVYFHDDLFLILSDIALISSSNNPRVIENYMICIPKFEVIFFPPRELSVVGCWFHSIVVRIIWYNSNDCFRLHEDLFVAKIQSVFLNAPCMVEKDVSMLLGWGGDL